MKDNLLTLISQIDTIEAKFHHTPSSSGYLMPSVDEIGDVPEFQIWIQNIQLELQEIVDRMGDHFVADTLECAKLHYDGWNDKKYFTALKGKLIAMRGNIEKYYAEDQLSKVKRSSEKANMEKEQQKSRRPRPPEGGIELRLIHLVRLVLVVRAD